MKLTLAPLEPQKDQSAAIMSEAITANQVWLTHFRGHKGGRN